MVLNTGSIRFDIFKGPFTRNDQVSPGLIEGNKRERNKTDMALLLTTLLVDHPAIQCVLHPTFELIEGPT